MTIAATSELPEMSRLGVAPTLSEGAPVYARYDGGEKQAVLLSPVLPAWDAGAYFAPLVAPLRAAGFTVTIYDTLAFADREDTFDALVSAWRGRLEAVGRLDLIGGAAFGGTVAQALLGVPHFADVARVLLISAPSRVDCELSEKLSELVALARDISVQACLEQLDYLVRRHGMTTNPFTGQALVRPGDDTAKKRLVIGFGALLSVDVSPAVKAYRGRVLHVLGQDSCLVTERHIAVDGSDRHRCALIQGAGMRPLSDQPEAALREVAEFLR